MENQGPCRCEPKSEPHDPSRELAELQDLTLNRSGSAIVIILCKKDFFNNVAPPDESDNIKRRGSSPQIMKMMKENALKFMNRVKDKMTNARKPEAVEAPETVEALETGEAPETAETRKSGISRSSGEPGTEETRKSGEPGTVETRRSGSTRSSGAPGEDPTETDADTDAGTDAEQTERDEPLSGEQLETESKAELSETASQDKKPCVCAERRARRQGSDSCESCSSSSGSFAELTAYHGKSRIRKRANAAHVRNVLSNIFGTELDEVDGIELRNITGSRSPHDMPIYGRRPYRGLSPPRRSATPSPHRQKMSRRGKEEGACCRCPTYRPIKGCPICVVCVNCGNKRKQHSRWMPR